MAQDFILQPLVEKEEARGPWEAFFKRKSENEIELVRSAFLSLSTIAIEAPEGNDVVDKKIPT